MGGCRRCPRRSLLRRPTRAAGWYGSKPGCGRGPGTSRRRSCAASSTRRSTGSITSGNTSCSPCWLWNAAPGRRIPPAGGSHRGPRSGIRRDDRRARPRCAAHRAARHGASVRGALETADVAPQRRPERSSPAGGPRRARRRPRLASIANAGGLTGTPYRRARPQRSGGDLEQRDGRRGEGAREPRVGHRLVGRVDDLVEVPVGVRVDRSGPDGRDPARDTALRRSCPDLLITTTVKASSALRRAA